MNTEQILLNKWRNLSLDKQEEVLDFVEFLEQKRITKKPRRSLKGLCLDLGITIAEDDISEARREMWGNFPTEEM
jgi:Protein of unknown function (DUF2281)